MRPDVKQNRLTQRRAERGFITLDFIFALVMAIGFATVFFSVTVTLALVEAAQYVTFATSRAYAAAHETETAQKDLALAKFNEIMEKSVFKTLLGQGWMKIGPAELGDFSSQYSTDPDYNTFIGAHVAMDAKLLHLRLPFIGSTAEDSNVGKATLNSYLNREVSTTECREQFNRARYQQILSLSGTYGGTPGGAAGAKLITDNGC